MFINHQGIFGQYECLVIALGYGENYSPAICENFEIGDGNDTSFWHDQRHPAGPLYKHFSGNLLRSFGLPVHDPVAKCMQDADWRWRLCGGKSTAEVRLLKQLTPTEFRPFLELKDTIVWLSSKSGCFTVKSALQAIRQAGPTVSWFKFHPVVAM